MKIAISGAGIAGPTLAFWLERSGHEPTLIEQAPHFRAGGYMIDFWGLGYTIAERMGILPEVLQRGYSVREVRLVNRQGRKAGGFRADVFRRMTHDRFTSLPRGDLAAAIYEALGDRVETIFGDSITGFDEHATGVRVQFEHGPEREFDLVIGADGLHSVVRRVAFGPENQFEAPLGYHVAACQAKGYRPRDELAYVSYARPGCQIARFSMRDDRTLFLFVFVSERIDGADPQSAEQKRALLRQVFGDAGWECPQILATIDEVEQIYFDRVSQIRLPEWSRGRVALIGDAAACVSLLAGEGTGLAMTEAYVLAGELRGAEGDYRRAFQNYELLMRTFIERKQKSARNFAGAFAPKTRAGLWFRNQVTRLLGIPAVADYFVGRDLRDDLELPDYDL